jgi:hypothetical protein
MEKVNIGQRLVPALLVRDMRESLALSEAGLCTNRVLSQSFDRHLG